MESDTESCKEFLGAQDFENNGLDLIKRMMIKDPDQRITAAAALQHPYFTELYPNSNVHSTS